MRPYPEFISFSRLKSALLEQLKSVLRAACRQGGLKWLGSSAYNQKGGVGKTTTALNLAAALARSGAQTLLVDLDPQSNATTGLGRQPTGNHPLVHCAPIRQGVLPTDIPRLDLLPGSRSFRDVEMLTRDDPHQSARLREHPPRARPSRRPRHCRGRRRQPPAAGHP
jgi:hypothetical protein